MSDSEQQHPDERQSDRSKLPRIAGGAPAATVHISGDEFFKALKSDDVQERLAEAQRLRDSGLFLPS